MTSSSSILEFTLAKLTILSSSGNTSQAVYEINAVTPDPIKLRIVDLSYILISQGSCCVIQQFSLFGATEWLTVIRLKEVVVLMGDQIGHEKRMRMRFPDPYKAREFEEVMLPLCKILSYEEYSLQNQQKRLSQPQMQQFSQTQSHQWSQPSQSLMDNNAPSCSNFSSQSSFSSQSVLKHQPGSSSQFGFGSQSMQPGASWGSQQNSQGLPALAQSSSSTSGKMVNLDAMVRSILSKSGASATAALPPIPRESLSSLIRLCLADEMFPEFVANVAKELNSIEQNSLR